MGDGAVNIFEFTNSKGRAVEMPWWFSQGEQIQIADTHAHLDMLEDPAGALARAAFVGVDNIVTICDVVEGADTTFSMLEVWREGAQNILDAHDVGKTAPRIRIVVGSHPHNAEAYLTDSRKCEELRKWASDPRVCGIGEVGLDYYYDHSPRSKQRVAYKEHIQIAKEFGLPIIIHLRDAHDDGLAILEEEGMPEAGAILHCFNREIEIARPFMDLGCHVSFAGPVTFKKAEEVREAAAHVPLARVLTETDCPFMAPEPFRGTKCEPAFTAWTATRIAETRDQAGCEGQAVFFRETYKNARSLLGF